MTQKIGQDRHLFDYSQEENMPLKNFDVKFSEVKYNEINFEENLNAEQLKVINNLRGPLLVIAGAGSGKTRTIVHAVAKLLLNGVHPSEIMLVTFTNKAAQELVSRVESLLGTRPKGIWAGTFHSMANKFLRIHIKQSDIAENYTILDNNDGKNLIRRLLRNNNIRELKKRFPTPAMIMVIRSLMINCNKSLNEVLEWKFPQFVDEEVENNLKIILKSYQEKKKESRLLDFEDLLIYWNKLLEQESFARSIAHRIKFVLVDEYQDTNHLQDKIIHKIVKLNPEQNVMVVGDDAQSIYGFRGANYLNILNFKKRFPNCKTYKLTKNYRSVPQILHLANESIKHNKKQFLKEMESIRMDYKKPFHVKVADDDEQARFISRQILRLRSERVPLHEIAILIRAGSHATKIELALRAHNIPYIMQAGDSFFEKGHIKDLLAHLRVIENPFDELSWARIFSIIPGIGEISAKRILGISLRKADPIKFLINQKFESYLKGARFPSWGLKNLRRYLKKLCELILLKPSEIIEKLANLLQEHVENRYENGEERIQDYLQLSVFAQRFLTIHSLLDNLSLNSSEVGSNLVITGSQKIEETPLVVSTIHRAKGLEWRCVFVPMLCEDFFPLSRVIGNEDEIEEERRIFYVAVTRAKEQLYLISPAVIQDQGKLMTNMHSRFVSELAKSVYTKSKVKFHSTRKNTERNELKTEEDLKRKLNKSNKNNGTKNSMGIYDRIQHFKLMNSRKLLK